MGGPAYTWGSWSFEPAEYRLARSGSIVTLPAKSLDLLAVLVARAPHMIPKADILAEVWPDAIVEEGNVAFHVAALRKVLDEAGEPSCIETVRARGYRFVAPLRVIIPDVPTATPDAPPAVMPTAAPPALVPLEAPAALPATSRRWSARLTALGIVLALTIAAVVTLGWPESESVDSVVVMPFHAIATSSDQAYLETGLAEAIAMRLGNVTALRVPPLAAVRGGEGPYEAGRRLAAEAVLTGTIQRAGDRLLVTTQLSHVRRGDRLWAWTFDTTAGEILTVQNEIAERIAVRLTTALTPADRERLTRRDTASGEAYDLFLQARERWQRRTPESVKQAIGLYEKAISIDPQFVRAYAGLADCYNLAMSGLPPNYRYPRAKANAEKALQLDPDSAEARTSLAFMRYKFEWRWQDADREFQHAIKLNPRYALAHHWYGEFLFLMDRPDEAIAELKRALELDPFSLAARADLTRPLMRVKRMTEARQVLQEGLQLDPNWYSFPAIMGEILAMEGRDRESAEHTWRGMALRAIPTAEVEELRAAFDKGGMAEMTRAQIRQLLRQDVKPTSSASFFIATFLSFAYGRLGDRERALYWLETAIERREDAAIHLLTNPAYDSIRHEPRFRRLLERLNLLQFVNG